MRSLGRLLWLPGPHGSAVETQRARSIEALECVPEWTVASAVLTQRKGQAWRDKSRTLGTNETKVWSEKKSEPKVKPPRRLEKDEPAKEAGEEQPGKSEQNKTREHFQKALHGLEDQ